MFLRRAIYIIEGARCSDTAEAMDTVEVTKIHKYRALRGELRKCDHQPEAGSIYMFSPLRAHPGNVTKLIRRMK